MKWNLIKNILRPRSWARAMTAAALIGLPVAWHIVQAQTPGSGKSPRNTSTVSGSETAIQGDIGQCRLEDIVPSQQARRLNAPAVCKINAAQAATLLAKPGALVIDPRAGHDSRRSRIRNSLPMSLSELRRRPDLRSTSMVAIGTGKDDAALFDQCGALREAGYKNLSVLAGGMASWHANGGEIMADQQTIQSLSRLSAREFLQRVVAKDATILLAPDSKAMSSLLKEAISIPALDLAQITAAARQTPGLPIVVVSSRAAPEGLLADASRAVKVPVFSFVGDRAEFEGVLRQHLALWERAAGGQRLKCPGL